MRTLLSFVLLVSAPSAALAQNVVVVDDDGGAGVFTTIQAAVDAAMPGDVVLVREGDYAGFTLSKGLVIHGDGATRPRVSAPIVIEDTTAADGVVLRALEVPGPANVLTFAQSMEIRNCAGPVWIEDLVTNPVQVGAVHTGTIVRDSASVTFVRCELRSIVDPSCDDGQIFCPVFRGAGLLTFDSDVHVYDSLLVGGVVGFEEHYGTPGLDVQGGSAFVSGSELRGADGLDGYDLLFCTGCHGGDGGAGVRANGARVQLVDTVATGGAPGQGDDNATGSCQAAPGGCPDGTPGPDFDVAGGLLLQETGLARSMTAVSPVRDGEDVVDTFVGEPGDFVVLAYSLSQVTGVQLLDVIGPGFIGNPAFLSGQGFLDATGEKVRVVPTGGLISGFAAVPVYKQAIVIDSTPQFRISSPSLLLLLDPSF